MNMAILGNVVTTWSWFGVNMLGIGLHSYGFTDQAFKWLLVTVGLHLLLVGLGLLPKHMWKSARTQNTASEKSPASPEKESPVSATA